MKNITISQVLSIILLVLLAIVIIQNWDTVEVKFLMFGLKMPMVILLILVFAAGYLSSSLVRRKASA
ncbi:MAG: hypothetical protein RMK52_04070 [Chitinophagales bacterium]|nr:hypothetical protein [Chitinophagales bacterium]MDW8393404.1 hypothetical protein [Chitinophagales bacterium]